MAKTIATVSGVALAPGVSKNGRLYTREAIAKAVSRARGRIADGADPLTILTHHEAGDDSSRIIGRITGMSVAEDGSARFTASIADTPHAKTIASLIDPTKGDPFLSGMSIRGAWVGKVRRVKGPAGDPVETADDLEFSGVDPTHKPGVTAARVDTFAWAKGGANETTERVLITESVQEARVTAITEETTPAAPVSEAMPADVREATRELLPLERPHLLANGLCRTCAELGEAATVAMSKRGGGLQGKSGTAYADPGYQPDKKQRYELDTKNHVKAAWTYISQADNAKAYTAAQLKRIKGRIKAAAGKFGITIASEGWMIDPAFQVTEAIAEFYGADTEQLAGAAGSYSLTASNGPTTVTVCSYGLDPADLAVILAKACEGAGNALASLDPDMDGDIDVPGADAEDTDGDMGDGDADTDGDGISDLATRLAAAIRGESTEDISDLVAEARNAGGVTETAPASQDPATGAGPNPREEPAVSEATTTEAVATPAAPTAPTVPQDAIDAAVAKALAADREARKARKAAKAQAAAPAESAPAAEATVTETADERVARLVEEKLAAINAPSPSAVAEAEEQRVERLVQEALTREKQTLATQGAGPSRKGLVTEHTAAQAATGEIPADLPMEGGKVIPMEKWTEAQYRAVGGVWQDYVLGDRAVY